MQLSSAKLRNKGTKGMIISFIKPEQRGNMTFSNEYPGVKFKVPVSPEIRKCLIDMEPAAMDLLCLEDGTEINVIGVISNEEKIQLMVEVTTNEGGVYPVTTAMVNDTSGYKFFDRLQKQVVKYYDEVAKYVSSSVAIKPAQIILEFQEHGSEKVRESLKDINVEELSKEDALKQACDLLEKAGCLVLKPDEVEA